MRHTFNSRTLPPTRDYEMRLNVSVELDLLLPSRPKCLREDFYFSPLNGGLSAEFRTYLNNPIMQHARKFVFTRYT